MNLLLIIWVIIAAIIWGDWKKVKDYHATMIYVGTANLLYYYLTGDYPLWEIKTKIIPNEKITELLHVSVVMTLSTFIFLSNFPKSSVKGGIVHVLKWVLIFSVLEWVGHYLGRMHYHHGWNFAWSVIFNVIMFPFIKLHYHKPVIAYLLSIVAIFFFMWKFQVPF